MSAHFSFEFGLEIWNSWSVYGNKTEWSPIWSVIITSNKQNWMSVGQESNLLS